MGTAESYSYLPINLCCLKPHIAFSFSIGSLVPTYSFSVGMGNQYV